MKKLSVILFTFMSLFFTFNSWGFWSLPEVNVADHGGITEKGLTKYYSYSLTSDYYKKITGQQSVGFLLEAMTQIADANESMDDGNSDEDIFHCDNEKITICSHIVTNFKKTIVVQLKKNIFRYKQGNKVSPLDHIQYSYLRKDLGKSLHTIQDFYSHSNWVERELYGKQTKIRIDENFETVEDNKKSSIKVNEDFFNQEDYSVDPVKGSTCITGPSLSNKNIVSPYNNLYLNNLTTGYYHKNKDIYKPFRLEGVVIGPYSYPSYKSYNYNYCNIPSLTNRKKGTCLINGIEQPLGYASEMKIIVSSDLSNREYDQSVGLSHDGPHFIGNKEKCVHSTSIRASLPSYTGIAKDHINSVHHQFARDVAERATGMYVKSIIDQVVQESGGGIITDWVIQKFLGINRAFPSDILAPLIVNTISIADIETGFKLSWTEAKGNVSKYVVYKSTVAGLLGEEIYSGLDREYNDTDKLVNGKTYYYTLKACNEFKCSLSNKSKHRYVISTSSHDPKILEAYPSKYRDISKLEAIDFTAVFDYEPAKVGIDYGDGSYEQMTKSSDLHWNSSHVFSDSPASRTIKVSAYKSPDTNEISDSKEFQIFFANNNGGDIDANGVTSGHVGYSGSIPNNYYVRVTPEAFMQDGNNSDGLNYGDGLRCKVQSNGSWGNTDCYLNEEADKAYFTTSAKYQVIFYEDENGDTHWNGNESEYCLGSGSELSSWESWSYIDCSKNIGFVNGLSINDDNHYDFSANAEANNFVLSNVASSKLKMTIQYGTGLEEKPMTYENQYRRWVATRVFSSTGSKKVIVRLYDKSNNLLDTSVYPISVDHIR